VRGREKGKRERVCVCDNREREGGKEEREGGEYIPQKRTYSTVTAEERKKEKRKKKERERTEAPIDSRAFSLCLSLFRDDLKKREVQTERRSTEITIRRKRCGT
jgi:hypothetical protein